MASIRVPAEQHIQRSAPELVQESLTNWLWDIGRRRSLGIECLKDFSNVRDAYFSSICGRFSARLTYAGDLRPYSSNSPVPVLGCQNHDVTRANDCNLFFIAHDRGKSCGKPIG